MALSFFNNIKPNKERSKNMQPDEIIAIKQEIIASVCKIISGLIDDTKRQFERTRQDVIEAPGRMQSRYDSSKQESGYLVDALQKRLMQIKGELITIGGVKIDRANTGVVEIGSLIEITEEKKKVLHNSPWRRRHNR